MLCVQGVISPLLSNLYLTEVDRMLERAKETTRCGKYTYIEYARFADDLVILIDANPRHDWLMRAVEKRLREELAELQVEINEEKSRIVDLGRGDSFGFLSKLFELDQRIQAVIPSLYQFAGAEYGGQISGYGKRGAEGGAGGSGLFA